MAWRSGRRYVTGSSCGAIVEIGRPSESGREDLRGPRMSWFLVTGVYLVRGGKTKVVAT